jgi:outer membrane protein assembly factor BamD
MTAAPGDTKTRLARPLSRWLSTALIWYPTALVLAPGLLMGCLEDKKPALTAAEYNDAARRAYDDAMDEYHDHNWEFATQKFTELRRNYPNTRYALLAQLRAADVLYEQARYPEAVSLYKTYISEHPTDGDVAYARFRSIESQVETSTNTVFQPPLEERDLANINEAYSEIRAFRADFPNYPEQDRLRHLLRVASGMLARHELYVARFYLRQEHFEAAVRRCQYALRSYENSGLEPEGIVLLGEIYLKQKRVREARAMFSHVLQSFPASPFVVPARHFLDTIAQKSGGAPTAATNAVSHNGTVAPNNFASGDTPLTTPPSAAPAE